MHFFSVVVVFVITIIKRSYKSGTKHTGNKNSYSDMYAFVTEIYFVVKEISQTIMISGVLHTQ